MDKPSGDIKISSLGKNSPVNDRKVKSVKLLGGNEKLKWEQLDDALVISRPSILPDWQVITFRIILK